MQGEPKLGALAASYFAALAVAWLVRALGIDVVPAMAVGAILVLLVDAAASRLAQSAYASAVALCAFVPLLMIARATLEDRADKAGDDETVLQFAAGGAIAYVLSLAMLVLITQRAPSLARLGVARAVALAAMGCSLACAAAGLAKRATRDDPATFRAGIEPIGCFAQWTPRGYEPVKQCHEIGGAAACIAQGEVRAALHTDAPEGCTVDVTDEISGERASLSIGTPVSNITCFDLCVERSPRAATWFVSSHDRMPTLAVFVGPQHDRHGGSVASFARDLAPPTSWSLAALLGVAIALVALLPRDRALRERLAWREETHDGVTWLVSPRAPADAYRAALVRDDPSLTVRGTHAELRATLDARRAAQWAFAATSALLLGAPLHVAAALGFVF